MAVAFGADDGQPGERAATIVSDLCALSDVILFSSADPLEAAMSGAFRSWPEVWALLFRDEGFSCFDLFGRQPSLIDEPGLIPSHAVLFVRRGSDAAERLDPWSADGLCRTCYTPDAVISFLKNAISRQPEDIEEARQSYRQGLDRIAAPLGSGFLAKDTPILRRLRRERDHARSMLAIEYQGGRITGERLGLAKGRDAERVRLEAERWEREGELTRTAERVHTELLKREDDFAQAADQFHAEISTLETESQRLRDIVTGFRQAYFRYSMDRRTRIISSLLPWFLKSRLHKRWLDRALDEIRRSTMFDAEYYLKENPDVKLTGMDPAEHYFISGAREGRNPSARFDTTGYIMKHCTEFNEGVNPLLDMIRSNRPHEQ